MKKFTPIILFLIIIFLITSCNSSAPDPASSQNSETGIGNGDVPDYTNLQLEASQQTYRFEPSAEGSMNGSYAFEVTNTSDVPLQVESYAVDFLDQEENVVSHNENVNLIPKIMQPGEKAYAGDIVNIEAPANPDDIKKMKVYLYSSKTSKVLEMFDFDNLNLMENTDGGSLIVTGKVTNNTSSDAELVSIAVVSMGENNKLLDVTYVSSIFTLSRGAESSFETKLNNSTLKKADIKNIYALGYDFTKTN